MTSRIPNYDLYGNRAEAGWTNTLNFEWIPERSTPHGFHIRPHRHDSMLQLLQIEKGHGEVHVNGMTWQMPASSITLVPAGCVHGFDFSHDVGGPVITAAQKPIESLARLIFPDLIDTIRHPVVMRVEQSNRHAELLMPMFLAVEREWRTSSTGQIAVCQALLVTLLIQVHRIKLSHGLANGPAAPVGHSRRHQQLESFRTLVDACFREHLPLQHYARSMNLSTGQLSRLCRETLGMSALEVINARLIHEAQRDLIYTSDSIKAVAARLGYVDEAYFSRFFRKHTGMSPVSFRREGLRKMERPASMATAARAMHETEEP